MKESEFIDKNKDKWSEYEELISKKNTDPDDLRDMFIQVTDDLSYSRSNYQNRSVRVYLNHVARQIFNLISRRRKFNTDKIKTFFTIEVPQLMFLARKEMLISLIVFLLAICIGIYSSIQDPEFARQILGDRYVEMTNANIANDDPMAVYRGGRELDSFLQILINNARIDILILALGIIFGFGALFVLVTNGIMLGVFQYYFFAHGGFEDSLLTIWLHGTIEISTIALMGGVGLLAGKGLLFPGSYTRYQSFRLSAGNASKLLLAILPFTFFAAVIESFITRQTGTPDVIKVLFIILSLTLVVFYFVWMPIQVNRKHGKNQEHETLRNPLPEPEVSIRNSKKLGIIISESFMLYKQRMLSNLGISVALAFLLTTLTFLFWGSEFAIPRWSALGSLQNGLVEMLGLQSMVMSSAQSSGYRMLLAGITSLAFIVFFVRLMKQVGASIGKKHLAKSWLYISCFLLVLCAAAFHHNERPFLISLLVLYALALIISWAISLALKNTFYPSGTITVRAVIIKPLTHLVFMLAMGVICSFIFMLFNSFLVAFLISFLQQLIPISTNGIEVITMGLKIGLFYTLFFGIMPLIFNGILLQSASIIEETQAPNLKADLERLNLLGK